jgi:hypothetical protein
VSTEDRLRSLHGDDLGVVDEAVDHGGGELFGRLDWWPGTVPGAGSVLISALSGKREIPGRPGQRLSNFKNAGITILRWSLHQSNTAPILGWYSPGLGHRAPAVSLLREGHCGPDASMITTMNFAGSAKSSAASQPQ